MKRKLVKHGLFGSIVSLITFMASCSNPDLSQFETKTGDLNITPPKTHTPGLDHHIPVYQGEMGKKQIFKAKFGRSEKSSGDTLKFSNGYRLLFGTKPGIESECMLYGQDNQSIKIVEHESGTVFVEFKNFETIPKSLNNIPVSNVSGGKHLLGFYSNKDVQAILTKESRSIFKLSPGGNLTISPSAYNDPSKADNKIIFSNGAELDLIDQHSKDIYGNGKFNDYRLSFTMTSQTGETLTFKNKHFNLYDEDGNRKLLKTVQGNPVETFAVDNFRTRYTPGR